MSDHPNAILMLVFEPPAPRKVFKKIVDKYDDVTIGERSYHCLLMENDYDEGVQISAPEGSIVIFSMVTYGYGVTITWEELEKLKNDLEKFGKSLSKKYKGAYSIHVTANHW